MNYTLEHKQKHYLNFNETGILITGSKVKTAEQFEKKSAKTGLLSMSWFIPAQNIFSFTINRLNGEIVVYNDKGEGKLKKEVLKPNDAEDGNKIADEMAELYGYNKTQNVEEPQWNIGLEYLFYFVLIAIFSWLLLKSAIEFEENGVVDLGNTRKKSAVLIIKLAAEYLGFWGCTGLITAVSGFTVFKLIKRLKSPAQIETYAKA